MFHRNLCQFRSSPVAQFDNPTPPIPPVSPKERNSDVFSPLLNNLSEMGSKGPNRSEQHHRRAIGRYNKTIDKISRISRQDLKNLSRKLSFLPKEHVKSGDEKGGGGQRETGVDTRQRVQDRKQQMNLVAWTRITPTNRFSISAHCRPGTVEEFLYAVRFSFGYRANVNKRSRKPITPDEV